MLSVLLAILPIIVMLSPAESLDNTATTGESVDNVAVGRPGVETVVEGGGPIGAPAAEEKDSSSGSDVSAHT